MYCIWFILNFPIYIHLVNVNTINRKETQGWLRGHCDIIGCMNCRVSGLVKNVPGLDFFVNGFLLIDCYILKIASLFQQQCWRSLLTSEITCLNDFVMLILARTTWAPRLNSTVITIEVWYWNKTRARELCFLNLSHYLYEPIS